MKNPSLFPADKNLLKVNKATLEQRPFGLCSSVTLLTPNRFLPAGFYIIFQVAKDLFKYSNTRLETFQWKKPCSKSEK